MKTQITSIAKGINHDSRRAIANQVIAENRDGMTLMIKGYELRLTANWSGSGKSVYYTCPLTDEQAIAMGMDTRVYQLEHAASLLIDTNMDVWVDVATRRTPRAAWKFRQDKQISNELVTIL